MRIKFLFILFCIICVISCKFDKSIEEPDINDQINDKYYVNFKNTSSHSVSVYLSYSRTSDNFFVEIPANSEQKKEIDFLGEETRTFYFVYNLNFGIKDFLFPYYNDKSLKNISITKNEINKCIIDEVIITEKELSFILLENNTTSDIYFLSGNIGIEPYKSNDKFVRTGCKALYIIDNSQYLTLSSLADIEIVTSGQIQKLSYFPRFNYKLGFVYNITCTNKGAILTSIKHLDNSEHNFNYHIDDEFHFESCFICEFETEPENHKFSLLQVDDINHWYTCICGLEDENSKLEHQYTSYYDENYHWNVCECGLGKEKIEHKFTVIYDNQFHWSTCLCGFTSKKSQHTLGNWQKIDGEDIKKCSLCDFTVTADENTHVFYSVSDLQNIKNNNTSFAIFELANDIDGGGQPWTPIDTFYGTLVGNGFSIKSFTINEESALDNNTAYCGVFYKNRGTIKNIFFKNITVDAYFEYQTDAWRYVNVGSVVAANYGRIDNVHLVNVSVNSNLIHKKDKSNDDVRQINIVGGIVGKNYETINYCSIKQSSISASTDSKYNWCDTSAWAGGICGENTKDCANLLSMNTSVSTSTKGGYNWWVGNDGHLKCYAGCVFGIIKGSGNNFNIISYENRLPQTYIYANSCDNTEQIHKKGYIYGVNEHKVSEAYVITDSSDLKSYSSTINSWDGWSVDVTNNNIENYLDFN